MKGTAIRKQIERPSERRKAVDARQDDQIEREAGQREAEMRERLADDRARAAAPRAVPSRPPCSKATPPSVADAHEQRLLQDQHEGGGNDIARIAARRVEQRLATGIRPESSAISGRVGEAAVGPCAARRRSRALTAPLASGMPCSMRL